MLGCWGVGVLGSWGVGVLGFGFGVLGLVLGQETETTKRSWQSDRYAQLTEHERALTASLNRSVRPIPNARPEQSSPLLKQVLNRVPVVSGDL